MSSEYADLVREQLDAIGYDSRAIPDNVLREFLADFEEQMDIGVDSESTPALSYPTALSSAEAQGVPRHVPLHYSSASAPQSAQRASSAVRRRKATGEKAEGAGPPLSTRTIPVVNDDAIPSPPLGVSDFTTDCVLRK